MNLNKRIIIYLCPKCKQSISFSQEELDIGEPYLGNLTSPNRFISVPRLFCIKCCVPVKVQIIEDVLETSIKTNILFSELK